MLFPGSRCFLFSIIFICQIVTVGAQDPAKIKLALSELQQATTDSARVEAYRDLSFNYSQINPDSGIYFGKRGLDLAVNINYLKGIGDSHNSLGWCYSNKGDYDKAKEHLLKAKKSFETIGDSCFIAVSLANLGNMYYNQGLKAEALEYFIQSTNIDKNCPDKGFKASGIYSIGTIYNSTNEYEKAINYFRQAYEINMANKDTNKAADCVNGIGNALLGLKEYDRAIKQFEESTKLYLSFNNINGAAYASESIGLVYLGQNQYDNALKYFFRAKEYFEQLGNKPDIAFELFTIGSTYKSKGEYKEAINYFTEGLKIANTNNFHSMRLQLYQGLTEVYELKKDYRQAYEHFKTVSVIKDSINKKNQQAKLDELLAKLDTEAKDRKIELLNKDQLLQEAESAKQKQLKNLFLVAALLLIILAYALFNRYQLKKKLAGDLEISNLQLQNEKERAERSEKFKQQFLANMSHEIRTPLNAIVGIMELISEAPEDKLNQKYLEAVRNSSKNLNTIVNDILDLSKIEAGKMELEKVPVNIKELLENVHKLFLHKALQKKLDFDFSVSSKIPEWIQGDPSRLTQVLVNLIGNGIKFTESGFVNVEVTSTDSSKNEELKSLKIRISDSGIGIPLADQSLIFDSFTQSGKSSGTGLGLTISKQLVSLMGGHIDVESSPGNGASFTIHLPLIELLPQNSLLKITKNKSSAILNNTLKILVVDDNEYNHLLVKGAIERRLKNIKITEVMDGRSAINHLRSCVEKNEAPDVILMDIQMPEMDGFETVKIIRNDLPQPIQSIPIIALTADVLTSNPESFKQTGFNEILSKPFQISDLIDKILSTSNATFKLNNVESAAGTGQVFETETRIVNLTYLNEFTDNDFSEIKKYIIVFNERIPLLLSNLQQALESFNHDRIKKILHSILPMIESMGMEKCKKYINELIEKLKIADIQTLKILVNAISADCQLAIMELQEIRENVYMDKKI